MSSQATPSQLIEGLHRGEPQARELLLSWCRGPIAKLVDRLAARRHLGHEREILVERALHWTAMYLRSREPAEFAGMGRNRFVADLLVRAYKLLTPLCPESAARARHNRGDRAHHLGPSPYDIRSYSRPLDSVGGDWSGVTAEGDDSVWVLTADVTGHGLPAYLVADGLPHLSGMRSIAELRARGCPPHDLLDALSDVLERVLPDAVFVEATLARFTPVGQAAFSGAGFCRVTLRHSGDDRLEIHRIGGPYLGLGSARRDHLEWAIRVDDEVMLASDGLFEQADGVSPRCPLEASLARRAAAHLAAGRTLHDAILAVLEGVLQGCRQHDDITVLTIRYRQEVSAGRGAEHVPV
jgi:hypothetical protein